MKPSKDQEHTDRRIAHTWSVVDESVMNAEPCDRIRRTCGAAQETSRLPPNTEARSRARSSWVAFTERWLDKAAFREAGSWANKTFGDVTGVSGGVVGVLLAAADSGGVTEV